MRAHSLWIVSLMAMLAASADAVAQKATYATGSDQQDSAGQPSGIAYLASGQWRDPVLSDSPSHAQPSRYAPQGQYPQQGQHQQPIMPQPGMGYPGMMPQPGMGYPGMMPQPGQYAGMPGVAPAGYNQSMGGAPMQDPNVQQASYDNGSCAECGGYGCDSCRGSGCGCGGNGCSACCGLLGGGQYCGFSRGIGNAWDLSEYGGRCAPRFFDASAEFTYFKYEGNTPSRAFASQGILGPTALDSNQLDFSNPQAGVRFTMNWLCFAGSTLEVSYMGIGNWASSAGANGAANLYSPLSSFGSNPFGGYAESDAADFVGLSMSNRFDTIEVNLKRGWTGAGCWFQGSWWGGFRYFRLSEDSNYVTNGPTGSMNYACNTDNDMYGAQLGGDLTTRLTTRLSLSGSLECGVYGNRGVQTTTILLNSAGSSATVLETAAANRASLVTEGGVSGSYKITPNMALKLGYQVIYVNGVALAVDNYNFTTGLGSAPAALASRGVQVDDNGSALYHGLTGGFELVW